MRATEILAYIDRKVPTDYTATHVDMSMLRQDADVKKIRRELQKEKTLPTAVDPYYETKLGKLYHGDCLDIMKSIPDKSIDMILCDLPYGTTSCSWDVIIPFNKMWEQYERIIKDNGAIVLTAIQPFSSLLVCSNIKLFKYEWIWDKVIGTDFLNANKKPLKGFENILVFYKKLPTYNPQKTKGAPYIDTRDNPTGERESKEYLGTKPKPVRQENNGDRHPRGIIRISSRDNKPLHPTQKPVDLFNYLIKTYTKEGDIILDNCAGSGTTGVACEKINREYILIEKEDKYCQIIKDRISEARREILTFGE